MEPFAPDAVAVLAQAAGHAARLGHGYIGGEHLLLALVSAGGPVAAVLHSYGVTPQRVEEEIALRAGQGAGAALFGGLDRAALAAIGIDLGAVRARIESSFGPQALIHAGHSVQQRSHGPRLDLRHPGRDLLIRLMRWWHRRREAAAEPIPLRAATGIWQRHRGRAMFIPFAPIARQLLPDIRRQWQARHDARPGAEHVALALFAANEVPVPAILAALGVSAATLRSAILGRCGAAS